MFDSLECQLCGGEQPPIFQPPYIPCPKCIAPVRHRFGLRRIDFGSGAGTDIWVILEAYCGLDVERMFHLRFERLHFLWCVLLGRGSPFRDFTYLGNGMRGNISQTEDIIDRIFSFLLLRCLP